MVMFCCFPGMSVVDEDMAPCKCFPTVDKSNHPGDGSNHPGDGSNHTPDTSSEQCLSGVVVTPVIIVLHDEDALSALPPRRKKTGSKVKVRRTNSMIDQTGLACSESETPSKQRSQSVSALDEFGNSEDEEVQDTSEESSTSGQTDGEATQRRITYSRYVSGDIDDLNDRKTSVINYSNGYAVRLK